MKSSLSVLRSRFAAILHDLLMVPAAWLGALWLRFNMGAVEEPFVQAALQALPLVMIVQGAFFWYFGLYRGVWRFASLPDLVRIIKAVFVGTAAAAVALFLLTRLHEIPRSIFPLYGLLLVMGLGGPRLIYRWFKDHRLYALGGRRVLLVGAGGAGDMMVREMLRDPQHTYAPIGFVDDNPRKKGREIQGVRVLGTSRDIPDLVESHGVEAIVIAIPSATKEQMQAIVSQCEKAGVPFRTLPPMEEIVTGQPTLKELREVSIEDLLGREPVSLDWSGIRAGLAGRKVLVSGGGGSIGAELCRQIAKLRPRSLMILEQSEFNLFQIESELRASFPELRLESCLADVVDPVAVDHLVDRFHPDVVFHAAAYKHVPMLQHQAREAARNNILGTRVLAEAADRVGTECFVLISTDKAVNPANVMGASKRVAEIFCQNFNARSQTHFITVRFGNVLGSAGSVVPIFQRQVRSGGPVTVTHPGMTRYFMTIPEACQLIMQAAAMGQGGEIFVLDMGEPVNIRYLAEQMIRLSGREPGRDIEIVYTGLRPGEKLYEELFHDKEPLSQTTHEKILLANCRSMDWGMLQKVLDDITDATERYDQAAIINAISHLVPEWQATDVGGDSNVVPLPQRHAT